MKWHTPRELLPEDGEVIETCDSGGNIRKLLYQKRMWWLPDGSMYVYYSPTKWRRIEKKFK